MKEKNNLIIPALRAHMGDWVYYVTFLRMEQIADQIRIAQEIHTSKVLKKMIQRQITNRAKQISDYLTKQPQRFFNSLIVGVYGGSPDWYELKIGTNPLFDTDTFPRELEGILGILRLDGTQTLFAIDGQHRVEGIKQALDENDALRSEEVSVIFVAHRNDPVGLERTRRLFTTLNRYAKPVSKSEIVALDEDDIVAITTRELVENHPLFQEKISLSKTKAVAVRDNRSFTTIINLYDVLEILLRENLKGWAEFKRHRPDDSVISKFYAKSARFWDTMIEYFPPLYEIRESQPGEDVAGHYRHKQGGHLLFRPVGLAIVVSAIREAIDSGLTEQEAIKRVSSISMDLADAPWAGLLWDKTNQRMLSAKANTKVAKQLLYYLLGGDLALMKTSADALEREYAGLLNRAEFKLRFPRLVDDRLETIKRNTEHNRENSTSFQQNALEQGQVRNLLQLMKLRFKEPLQDEPYFRIFAVPTTLNPDAVPTQEKKIHTILRNPPIARYGGFGVRKATAIPSSTEGIRVANTWKDQEVTLLRNGFLELTTPLFNTQFQWYKQESKIPAGSNWLYPYAVCEYPVTFMMLVKAIYSVAGIDSQIHVQQEYHNLNGFLLVGRHPLNPLFGKLDHERCVYNSFEPIVSHQTVNPCFDADQVAYNLVKRVYASFGLSEELIPLFDENHHFTP